MHAYILGVFMICFEISTELIIFLVFVDKLYSNILFLILQSINLVRSHNVLNQHVDSLGHNKIC